MASSTKVSSRGSWEAESLSQLPSGSWTQPSRAGRCPGRGGTPQPTVPQDLLDHVALRRLDEGDDLHLAATLGTGQRVDLVHPLDEHGPGLAGAAAGRCRCGRLARRGGGGFGPLAPQAAGLVRVPAVVADQMRALGRNVLRELRQEIQRREDLEIPLGAGGQAVALRVGEGPAGVFLGLVDDLPGRWSP